MPRDYPLGDLIDGDAGHAYSSVMKYGPSLLPIIREVHNLSFAAVRDWVSRGWLELHTLLLSFGLPTGRPGEDLSDIRHVGCRARIG